MSSNILRRAYKRSSSILSQYQSISTLFVSPSVHQSTDFSASIDKPQNYLPEFELTSTNSSGVSVLSNKILNFSCVSSLNNKRLLFSTQAAVEPSTSDGLTVDAIVANQWTILDESENDWKSHASAIAQSIRLIKKRLQWEKLKVRLEMLSFQIEKPDLWDDPVHAGKISREHGSLMGKMKEVNGLEQELLEHIDMIKLAREENDPDLESESVKALLRMRQSVKEKELEALLAGEHDSWSCYIEVQAGAGGTESMDWAGMVMQMYKMWAERRGYGVSVVDEMRGEIAGIKERIPIRLNLGISESFIKKIESNLTQEKQEKNHQEVLTQPQPPPKMKASNFPAVFLRIGSWNWASGNEGDLMIKFYYGKKKLVWEFLFGSLKKKIEIGWTNVSAINAYVDDDNMGRLEIELAEPPEYYDECKFQPLKHTQWEKTNDDFTGGQAQSCKRHTIVFSPGILDEHLERLLQYDNRLLNLSRQPFPIHNSTFFNTNMEVAYYNHQGTVVPSVQIINLVQPITSCIVENFHSNLPMPDVPFANLDETAYVNERNNGVWEQSESNQIQKNLLSSIMEEDYRLVFDELEPLIPDQQLELKDVDNQKLSEVTTTQNCVEVDSTFKPLEQNHENNSSPCGNEISDNGNHHVGLLDMDPGLAFKEEITSSSDCGLSYVACADDDVSGFAELQFNDELTIQEQDSWLSSQFNMNGEFSLKDSNSMGGSSS